MRGALDVHRELLARDVPHEVVRLPSRLLSADDLPAALGLEHGCVAVRCYVVEAGVVAAGVVEAGVVAAGARPAFAAVLVPAGAVPGPEALLDALSARSVRPARPEQVNAVTDYAAGLVCPVGLPPQVVVLADEALTRSATSYCALGEGGVALGIRTADLLEVTGARTAALTDGSPPRTIELDPHPSARPAPRAAP